MDTQSKATEILNLIESEFPGIRQDGHIDPFALLGALGLRPEEEQQLYSFSWAGQRKAERLATDPTSATLSPIPERSVDWEATRHLLIEGDNLQALKILYRGLHDQVKLIYLDPPYNTSSTFTYSDDFSVPEAEYLLKTGQVDNSGNLLSSKVDTAGSKHAGWLTLMLPRLILARQLLHEDGILFISIDDHEVHHLRLLLDGVFGPENRLATLIWNKNHSQQQGIFKEYHEYVLVYAKEAHGFKPFAASTDDDIIAGALKRISRANPASDFTFPAGVRCEAPDGTEFQGRWGKGETVELVSGRFRVMNGHTQDEMTLRAGWTQKEQMTRMFYGDGSPVFDTRGQEVLEFYFNRNGKLKCRKKRGVFTPKTVMEWGTQSQATDELRQLFDGEAVFDVPKPTSMLRDFVSWTCRNDGDVALDFFAGSGTLGQAIYEQNSQDGIQRRFILVQAPEEAKGLSQEVKAKFGISKIIDVTRERLIRAASRVQTPLQRGQDNPDLGFRMFRVSEGVLPGWLPPPADATGHDYVEAATLFAEATTSVPEEHARDALWEVILKGTSCDPTATIDLCAGTNGIYQVRQDGKFEGRLFVSVSPHLDSHEIESLSLTEHDTLVCFSGALTDTDAINLALNARLLFIERVPGAVSV